MVTICIFILPPPYLLSRGTPENLQFFCRFKLFYKQKKTRPNLSKERFEPCFDYRYIRLNYLLTVYQVAPSTSSEVVVQPVPMTIFPV